MAISKNTQRIYQIYKDEAKQHSPAFPLVPVNPNAPFLFAFDSDSPLEGVFVMNNQAGGGGGDDNLLGQPSLVAGLDVYTDGTVYEMTDYSTTTLTFNGVDYTFTVFGFTTIPTQPEVIP